MTLKRTSIFTATFLVILFAAVFGYFCYLLITNLINQFSPSNIFDSIGGIVIGMPIIVIFLYAFKNASKKVSEFTFKSWIFKFLGLIGLVTFGYGLAVIFIQQVFFYRNFLFEMFFLISILLLIIITLYVYHHRILGAGEAHLFAVKLLSDFEDDPELNKLLIRDFKGFAKGIDDWCAEILKFRIENLKEFTNAATSQLITHFNECKQKLSLDLFNENFFEQIKDHKNSKNLYNILERISKTFEVKLKFKNETLSSIITRNLDSKGAMSTFFSFFFLNMF